MGASNPNTNEGNSDTEAEQAEGMNAGGERSLRAVLASRKRRRVVVESDSEVETEVEAQARVAGATGNGGESGRAEKRRKTGGASVRLGGGGKPGVLE